MNTSQKIAMPTWQKSISAFLLVSLMFTGSVGTLSKVSAQPSSAKETKFNPATLIKDELYFGRSQPGGGIVSEEQWQEFLNTEVTPRFSDGLTVIDAYGQFLNSSGSIDREDTKVLILIYPSSQNKEKAVQEIINLYKSFFQQESVLRVTSVPARVSF